MALFIFSYYSLPHKLLESIISKTKLRNQLKNSATPINPDGLAKGPRVLVGLLLWGAYVQLFLLISGGSCLQTSTRSERKRSSSESFLGRRASLSILASAWRMAFTK